MVIRIVSGAGIGPTRVAAFDSALHRAGIGGFNVVRLSSVVPLGASVVLASDDDADSGDGDLLYAVVARTFASVGRGSYAGLGWGVTEALGGVFVEAEGAAEGLVRRDIEESLQAMAVTRNCGWDVSGVKIAHAQSNDAVSCAVVAAIYKRASWD